MKRFFLLPFIMSLLTAISFLFILFMNLGCGEGGCGPDPDPDPLPPCELGHNTSCNGYAVNIKEASQPLPDTVYNTDQIPIIKILFTTTMDPTTIEFKLLDNENNVYVDPVGYNTSWDTNNEAYTVTFGDGTYEGALAVLNAEKTYTIQLTNKLRTLASTTTLACPLKYCESDDVIVYSRTFTAPPAKKCCQQPEQKIAPTVESTVLSEVDHTGVTVNEDITIVYKEDGNGPTTEIDYYEVPSGGNIFFTITFNELVDASTMTAFAYEYAGDKGLGLKGGGEITVFALPPSEEFPCPTAAEFPRADELTNTGKIVTDRYVIYIRNLTKGNMHELVANVPTGGQSSIKDGCGNPMEATETYSIFIKSKCSEDIPDLVEEMRLDPSHIVFDDEPDSFKWAVSFNEFVTFNDPITQYVACGADGGFELKPVEPTSSSPVLMEDGTADTRIYSKTWEFTFPGLSKWPGPSSSYNIVVQKNGVNNICHEIPDTTEAVTWDLVVIFYKCSEDILDPTLEDVEKDGFSVLTEDHVLYYDPYDDVCLTFVFSEAVINFDIEHLILEYIEGPTPDANLEMKITAHHGKTRFDVCFIADNWVDQGPGGERDSFELSVTKAVQDPCGHEIATVDSNGEKFTIVTQNLCYTDETPPTVVSPLSHQANFDNPEEFGYDLKFSKPVRFDSVSANLKIIPTAETLADKPNISTNFTITKISNKHYKIDFPDVSVTDSTDDTLWEKGDTFTLQVGGLDVDKPLVDFCGHEMVVTIDTVETDFVNIDIEVTDDCGADEIPPTVLNVKRYLIGAGTTQMEYIVTFSEPVFFVESGVKLDPTCGADGGTALSFNGTVYVLNEPPYDNTVFKVLIKGLDNGDKFCLNFLKLTLPTVPGGIADECGNPLGEDVSILMEVLSSQVGTDCTNPFDLNGFEGGWFTIPGTYGPPDTNSYPLTYWNCSYGLNELKGVFWGVYTASPGTMRMIIAGAQGNLTVYDGGTPGSLIDACDFTNMNPLFCGSSYSYVYTDNQPDPNQPRRYLIMMHNGEQPLVDPMLFLRDINCATFKPTLIPEAYVPAAGKEGIYLSPEDPFSWAITEDVINMEKGSITFSDANGTWTETHNLTDEFEVSEDPAIFFGFKATQFFPPSEFRLPPNTKINVGYDFYTDLCDEVPINGTNSFFTHPCNPLSMRMLEPSYLREVPLDAIIQVWFSRKVRIDEAFVKITALYPGEDGVPVEDVLVTRQPMDLNWVQRIGTFNYGTYSGGLTFPQNGTFNIEIEATDRACDYKYTDTFSFETISCKGGTLIAQPKMIGPANTLNVNAPALAYDGVDPEPFYTNSSGTQFCDMDGYYGTENGIVIEFSKPMDMSKGYVKILENDVLREDYIKDPATGETYNPLYYPIWLNSVYAKWIEPYHTTGSAGVECVSFESGTRLKIRTHRDLYPDSKVTVVLELFEDLLCKTPINYSFVFYTGETEMGENCSSPIPLSQGPNTCNWTADNRDHINNQLPTACGEYTVGTDIVFSYVATQNGLVTISMVDVESVLPMIAYALDTNECGNITALPTTDCDPNPFNDRTTPSHCLDFHCGASVDDQLFFHVQTDEVYTIFGLNPKPFPDADTPSVKLNLDFVPDDLCPLAGNPPQKGFTYFREGSTLVKDLNDEDGDGLTNDWIPAPNAEQPGELINLNGSYGDAEDDWLFLESINDCTEVSGSLNEEGSGGEGSTHGIDYFRMTAKAGSNKVFLVETEYCTENKTGNNNTSVQLFKPVEAFDNAYEPMSPRIYQCNDPETCVTTTRGWVRLKEGDYSHFFLRVEEEVGAGLFTDPKDYTVNMCVDKVLDLHTYEYVLDYENSLFGDPITKWSACCDGSSLGCVPYPQSKDPNNCGYNEQLLVPTNYNIPNFPFEATDMELSIDEPDALIWDMHLYVDMVLPFHPPTGDGCKYELITVVGYIEDFSGKDPACANLRITPSSVVPNSKLEQEQTPLRFICEEHGAMDYYNRKISQTASSFNDFRGRQAQGVFFLRMAKFDPNDSCFEPTGWQCGANPDITVRSVRLVVEYYYE